jgi:hypothetical protein
MQMLERIMTMMNNLILSEFLTSQNPTTMIINHPILHLCLSI